jgi:hypothetical protein
LARHIPSQRRKLDRDEAEHLIRDLESLVHIASEENKVSPVEDHSEALTLRSETLGKIDNLLRKGEIREVFVSIAIEHEIRRRQSEVETEKQARKE